MSPPEDPNEVARLIALTELANAEASIFSKVWDIFKEWAVRLRRAVFGSSHSQAHPGGFHTPDPLGVLSTSKWWDQKVDDLLPQITEVWTDGYAGLPEAPPWEPDGLYSVKQAARDARNRLVKVPDHVFASVRGATMKATAEGWSMDDLAARVGDILGEHGIEQWRGRAMTIARTEALSAYNGGKMASFVSFAGSAGGDWEKVWLATHDHRTRFTHTGRGGGDGQRVPLLEPFRLGEDQAPVMYPGDPEGPVGETANCRCTILLVEPGEHVDMTDRQYRSAR